MYLYLLMAIVALFGVWFTRSLEKASSPSMSFSNKPLWKAIGKITVVAVLFLTSISLMSDHAARLYKSGLAAYNQGHYATAESDLRQADKFYPRNVSTHYYLALSLLHDGKKADALAEFRSVYSMSHSGRYIGDQKHQLGQEAADQIEQLSGAPP